MSEEDHLLLEANHFGLLASSADMREGMSAFLEKRKPHLPGALIPAIPTLQFDPSSGLNFGAARFPAPRPPARAPRSAAPPTRHGGVPEPCRGPTWTSRPVGSCSPGPNGQGKTNLLEAVSYPVLFRSFRGAARRRAGPVRGAGIPGRASPSTTDGAQRAAEAAFQRRGPPEAVVAGRGRGTTAGRRGGSLAGGGVPARRRGTGLGAGAAAAAVSRPGAGALRPELPRGAVPLPRRAGPAERRAPAGPPGVAEAFDAPLAELGQPAGHRPGWRGSRWCGDLFASRARRRWARQGLIALEYAGAAELADAGRLAGRAGPRPPRRDRARRATTRRPAPRRPGAAARTGRSLRDYGSTGQQRSAAIVLRLVELVTLERARGEPRRRSCWTMSSPSWTSSGSGGWPARLLAGGGGQVLITAPRTDELPPGLDLPAWTCLGRRGENSVKDEAATPSCQPACSEALQHWVATSGLGPRHRAGGGAEPLGRAGGAADRRRSRSPSRSPRTGCSGSG